MPDYEELAAQSEWIASSDAIDWSKWSPKDFKAAVRKMDLAIAGDWVMLDQRESDAVIAAFEALDFLSNGHGESCDCLQCDVLNLIHAALERL